ncbi:YkvI family membrane protein [Rothia kristinae]|uniref:YkvI family membrane protein n=1 Tax=Rothia kristinae TaxID=37923 RepID=UPI00244C30CB|nr:hypothetical protein [Rothia kristinae]WGH08512.1 hypothetical protein OU799_05860 [Rothia kristinae]
MSVKRTARIALSFVGLLVGAGFATGQEVIQYFISFGSWGIAGAVLAGIVMAAAGAVILQLGSYFLADEHNRVFRSVSYPVIAKLLDASVTITLFAIGFVMLAGAGSNLQQQFGLPAWIGSAIMLVLVMVTGLLDVDRVSNIISAVTPLIIIAVCAAFLWTLFHLPSDLSALDHLAAAQESPVSPWWVSALNYNGLALILGVSMCLVIGGNNTDPREAGWGGLAGGILYTVMLIMAAVTLYANIAVVGDSSVPMLKLFEHIHPVLAQIMVWIIFLMIYNTAIGMFYALGRRLSAGREQRYRPIFLVVCLLGFAVSFVGFETLMTYVYPVIGWIGAAMVLVLLGWWVLNRRDILAEGDRRRNLRALLYLRDHPEREYSDAHAARAERIAEDSVVEAPQVTAAIDVEVLRDLNRDEDVDSERIHREQDR